MNTREESAGPVPPLDAVLEPLAGEVKIWAAGLGIELTYTARGWKKAADTTEAMSLPMAGLSSGGEDSGQRH
jgi:hypothetical protein